MLHIAKHPIANVLDAFRHGGMFGVAWIELKSGIRYLLCIGEWNTLFINGNREGWAISLGWVLLDKRQL